MIRNAHGALRGLCRVFMVTLALAAAAQAQDAERDPHVTKRKAAMNEAREALALLNDMATAKTTFISKDARASRTKLIRFARAIPSLFRRQRMDTHTRARPDIWVRWRDFKDRADYAEDAARALDIRSPTRLQQSMTPMLQGCISCHAQFRRPDPDP